MDGAGGPARAGAREAGDETRQLRGARGPCPAARSAAVSHATCFAACVWTRGGEGGTPPKRVHQQFKFTKIYKQSLNKF